MNSLAPVFSSDRPIEDESVTFVVDTNVFVEFQSIGQIDWSLLCPRAKSVRVVVPATVIREMDKHKRSASRLRRRAFEFNNLLHAIEDGDGTNTTLQGNRVELSLMLMERYARHELPEEKLSFEIADDLIVAEAVKFSQSHGKAIFLTDDSNARRTAREMGIRVARPIENWRRKEPRDRRDARIEELERQIGAMPRLSLQLLEEGEDAVVFETLREEDVPVEFCEQVGQAILERNPGVDRDKLFRRHNLPSVQSPGRPAGASDRLFRRHNLPSVQSSFANFRSVTVAQVDRYRDDYEQYRRRVIEWSRHLPRTMSGLGFVAPMGLEISNDGEAFAGNVEVTVRAPKGYRFRTSHLVRSFLKIDIEVPKPPSGTNLPNFFKQQELHRRDPFAFYSGNAPDRDEALSDISYECERFRHGTRYVLSNSLFKDDNGPPGGELIARASSASLVDPVEMRYPIRIRPEEGSVDFRSYFRQRLFFFPEDIGDAVKQVLADF